MPVVRGDRLSESQRLNRRSREAADFYANLVSKVPDSFRRFRLSPTLILGSMYPRRDPTPGLVRQVKRLLHELGAGPDPLWKTWEVDGVMFAELTTGKNTGNLYHRTPEPPWSEHVHTEACKSTAMARMREWGTKQDVEALSIHFKKIQAGRGGGEASEGGGERPRKLPPSVPSVPSVPERVPIGVIGGRALESPASGNGRPPAPDASSQPIDQAPPDTERPPTGEELWAANEAVQAQRRRVSDYDPGRLLEVQVVDRCLDLAAKLAAREFQELGDDHIQRALEAMTTTKRGVPMRIVKGAKTAWLEASLRQADEFEEAEFGGGDGGDEPLELLNLDEPDEHPPPKRGP